MHRLVLALTLAGCWTSSSPPPAEPKPQIKELVQPVMIEKQELAGEEGGVEGGVEGGDPCGGVPGGVVGGVIGGGVGAPPPPPPPPPMPPQNIPPTLLEGSRIAGDKYIQPTDLTKVAIMQAGRNKLVGSFKLCVTTQGDVMSVSQLKSTGFPDYDQKILTEMRTNWRYRPYLVNGKAVPVCTAVTFIYSQGAPPPPPPLTQP